METLTISVLELSLEIGAFAPEFEGRDQEGKAVRLSFTSYSYVKGVQGCKEWLSGWRNLARSVKTFMNAVKNNKAYYHCYCY